MSEITSKKWSDLYREAIFETDRGTLQHRIEEAHRAIQRRAHELWYAGTPETRERRDLDSAARFLSLLRSVVLRGDVNMP